MPSILDKLKRKPKTEYNPFTGQEVEVKHITQEEIQTFQTAERVVYEDRLAKWSRVGIRTIAIIVSGFNALMLLGYIQAVDLPFALIFLFSTYFSLAYLKRRHSPGSTDSDV